MASGSDGDGQPAERLARMLTERTLPRLVSEGAFGRGWRVAAAEAYPIGGFGQDHWASTTLTTVLDLQRGDAADGGDAEDRRVALVSKCMLPDDGFEGFTVLDAQASNEVHMYNTVFPFFARLADGSGVSVADLHPKCYLAELGTEGLLSLSVMQDLRADGFSLSKKRTELDLAHVKLALRAVGRMHALSHAAKARPRCREEFLSRVTPVLRESSYVPESRAKWSELLRHPFVRGLRRAADRVLAADNDADAADRQPQRRAALRRLEAAADDVFTIMQRASAASEPTSVLVHGDFCRNNMQFVYDDDGQPSKVCFFDFQNSRYCSPAVDLSFFLFLSTSAEQREAHWDEMLQAYWDGLEDALDKLLDGHPVHPDFVRPTLEALRAELKQHALWGYVICAFFLPMMMVPPEELLPQDTIKEMVANDPDATLEMMTNLGGDRASDALADVLMFFIDRDLIPS